MSKQLPADGAEPDRAAEYERARREQLQQEHQEVPAEERWQADRVEDEREAEAEKW